MEKISAVYKIVNEVTGDCYVGSSRNVMKRWANHKCPSEWKKQPNNKLYQDIQKYGVDKFIFQILVPIIPECLKQVEQKFIEMLNPSYNDRNAKGKNVERIKTTDKMYKQSEKGKKAQRRYLQSEKGKGTRKKYFGQLCSYNGETLGMRALMCRFRKAGIPNPTAEAKKYILEENNDDDKLQ